MHAHVQTCMHTHTHLHNLRTSSNHIRGSSVKLLSHKGNLEDSLKAHSKLHISKAPYIYTLYYLQYNTALLPSVNTLIAQGMFCGGKYTYPTFTPIVKHFMTTTANKHPGKMSFIDENMKNPTGIKLCISHKTATSRGPPS